MITLSDITLDINKSGIISWWATNINSSPHLHNNNGPAVSGDNLWYANDKQHRINGPAVIRANGDKKWYVNGTRHRLDGPAIEYTNGYNEWYISGIEYNTEFEYWIAVQKYVDMHQHA